jgi:hypothetical protein
VIDDVGEEHHGFLGVDGCDRLSLDQLGELVDSHE